MKDKKNQGAFIDKRHLDINVMKLATGYLCLSP